MNQSLRGKRWTNLEVILKRDGELGCLCGKAGTSNLCDGSAHSSGCVVNAMAAITKTGNIIKCDLQALLQLV